MRYILMLYSEEAGWTRLTKAEQDQWMAAYKSYMEAMTTAGVLVDSHRLQPSSTAKTVCVTNGKTQVLDGPHGNLKEKLSGYFIIDVADLDAAILWAAQCPAASHGVVEVRPSGCISV